MNKKNKKTKVNVKTVLMSKGFYITLATLIMVFGTAAVVRKFTADVEINNSSFDDTAWMAAVEEAEKTDIAEISESQEEKEILNEDFPKISEPTAMVNAKMTDEDIIKTLNMSLPLKGTITRKHSPTEHVYYKTTDDWRTHNGLDISSKSGEIVSASADGVVEEVYEDDRLGIVVLIGHEGGIKTLYGNLADKDFIEVGRKVAKGDTIGSVGNTSLIEGNDKPHIHFEIIKDGESQNPSLYIPLYKNEANASFFIMEFFSFHKAFSPYRQWEYQGERLQYILHMLIK